MIPLRVDLPQLRLPWVCAALFLACMAVFLWQSTLSPRDAQLAVYALGATPAALFGHATLPTDARWLPIPLTVPASLFLHGGWFHLLGNLLYLWIFGPAIEDRLGSLRFLAFFLLCGVVAVLAQALPDPHAQTPVIGASGAISGILGAYLPLLPRARLRVWLPIPPRFPVVLLPIVALLGFWFAIQLASSVWAPADTGIAFRAHIGGFLAGVVLGLIHLRLRPARSGARANR